MTDSHRLLLDYVRNGSEGAFRELVDRYLGLVYSTALRMVGGDAHRAEDISQTVFLDLARWASKLSAEVMLGGWLHRHTCYVAATLMRGERRREARERLAVEMISLNKNQDDDLSSITPLLDAAVNELEEEDRKAILLRFYERWDLRSIGEALGASENAAQKRVSRALDQLQSILKRRGVTTSAAVLGALLAGETLTAPPTGLAASIVGSALAGAAAGGGLSVTLFKLTTLTKLKVGLAAALATGGVATTLLLQHQRSLRLEEENLFLRQQMAQIARAAAENERAAALVENRPAYQEQRRAPIDSRAGQPRSPASDVDVNLSQPGVAQIATASQPIVAPLYGSAVQFARFVPVGGKVRIEGTSSVHDWRLESSTLDGYLEVGPNFPNESSRTAVAGEVQARGLVKIPVRSLVSVEKDGRKYSDRMDDVMYEHLRSKVNPWIEYHVDRLVLKENEKGRKKEPPYLFDVKGNLAIAGVTNEVDLPVEVTPIGHKEMKITGATSLRMTDFEVEPPKVHELGIQTGDDLKLSFEWTFHQTSR
jgi:RNA polymerase sigma factor (sigma-70 family)